MAKTSKPCATATPAANLPREYYQLHALLQTLRSLAQHEDNICTLLVEIEHSAKVTASTRRELGKILNFLHIDALNHEVDALLTSQESKAA